MRTFAAFLTIPLGLAPLAAQDIGHDAPELEWTKTYNIDDITAK
jgi:hypothetical protein